MKAIFTLTNTAYKHITGSNISDMREIQNIKVLKNEEFGLQLLIESDEEFIAVRGKYMDIAWKGLINKIRVEITAMDSKDGHDLSQYFKVNLVDYVLDDEKNLIADRLMNSNSRLAVTLDQMVYITGRLPEDYSGSEIKLCIKAFYSKAYEDEDLVYKKEVPILVHNYSIADIKDSEFYMDLWQHPCNWARIYDLPYYGEEHFEVIDNYLKGMSVLGQKVCNLVISDYPWAGQRCYKIEENHMNLFELNIVKVVKDSTGNFKCDFTAMDKYINLAKKHNMLDEINIFGILGNWDGYDFGNPLKDYRDPIRISYYDEPTASFRYISTKEDLTTYIRLVFNHIKAIGFWEKTLIMSDEPDDPELFKKAEQVLSEAACGSKIKIKCAIHDQKFLEEYGENIKSVSLNTCELVNNLEGIDSIQKNIQLKGGTITWFSCCFPSQLNIFLKSPLIESRLIGWFTYYMNMDGFLRWAYGIWPRDVTKDASYKKEKWAAGDMFLVYPGKNKKPEESVRLKNIIYGLQDWILLKKSEKIIGKDAIYAKLENLLGKKEDMKFVPEREVELFHSLEYHSYMELREWIISKLIEEEKDCIF